MQSSSHPTPGRTCPPHFRYDAGELRPAVTVEADTVYVAGGLYGNLGALDALEALAQADRASGQRVAAVLNGDFHWFDADPAWFAEVNRRCLAHTPAAGNVELELAAPSASVGCACGYPEHISEATVSRSNEIMEWLQSESSSHGRTALRNLPKTIAARIGSHRILILHGDTHSVAGWRFAVENLPPSDSPIRRRLNVKAAPTALEELSSAFRTTNTQIIACTHTCLPAYCQLVVDGNECALLNNGAAGMPNFKNSCYGLATRISVEPRAPASALFGFSVGDLRCDAVALTYDHQAWLGRFLSVWPKGSSGYIGYSDRLCQGPEFNLEEARRDYRERKLRRA